MNLAYIRKNHLHNLGFIENWVNVNYMGPNPPPPPRILLLWGEEGFRADCWMRRRGRGASVKTALFLYNARRLCCGGFGREKYPLDENKLIFQGGKLFRAIIMAFLEQNLVEQAVTVL